MHQCSTSLTVTQQLCGAYECSTKYTSASSPRVRWASSVSNLSSSIGGTDLSSSGGTILHPLLVVKYVVAVASFNVYEYGF